MKTEHFNRGRLPLVAMRKVGKTPPKPKGVPIRKPNPDHAPRPGTFDKPGLDRQQPPKKPPRK